MFPCHRASRVRVVLAAVLAACALSATPGDEPAAETAVPVRGPFLRVLGTAQDGGLPHAACTCVRCERARHDPAFRRAVASLALVVPAPGGAAEVYLVDATPDLREQLDRLADVRAARRGGVARAPLDGVFLTHAHLGHYTGLAFFGFEAVHTRAMPVWCTPRMAAFLRGHGPWSQLVQIGNLDLHEVEHGGEVELGGSVRVGFLKVPHRDEYADTVGFVVRGPERSVLYVPDTDTWETWAPSLPEVLEGIDVAILDGSFYSLDELPGRDLASIKHPLITRSMDLLQARVSAGKTQVYFTHMNHSNPAIEPDGAARREIEARGFGILADGQEIPL